ncbi:MAG: hypothetical protein ABFD94_18945, partial [Armatimonadia bacterium]
HDMLDFVSALSPEDIMAVEWINAMGMAVGREVFETCLWAGRFTMAAPCVSRLVHRGLIKLHHCGSSRAKDGNIVQALKDKYGDKGTKSSPGYFYGIASHMWQAFAIASYVLEGASDPKEFIFQPYTKKHERRTEANRGPVPQSRL